MDKILDPRWFGGFRRTYRNFLLIHFFQFRNYTLPRARTHEQHKSETRNALMDKMFEPRWFGGFKTTIETSAHSLFYNFKITLYSEPEHMNS